MGKIKKGILGGLSGKVGNVVGASWKGIDYLRSLPSSVRNPRTEKQQITRMKLNLVVRFLKSCITLVRFGFSSYAVKMSAFNAATSYNLNQAVTGVFPELALDFSALRVSRGNLLPPANAMVMSNEAGVLSVHWDDNSGQENGRADDTAMVLVYNPELGVSITRTEGATRSSSEASVNIPDHWSGSTLHTYVAFANTTMNVGTRQADFISDSQYAGEVAAV